MAAKESRAWVGFVVFAGIMLVVIGAVNLFEGLIALFTDERVAISEGNLVIVDLTAWGWVLLVFGLVMMAAGYGLLAAQTWARITAIVVVGLHAIAQILWLGAYPVWSLLMVALDTVILFALTARWSGMRDEFGGMDESAWKDRPRSEGEVSGTSVGRPMP